MSAFQMKDHSLFILYRHFLNGQNEGNLCVSRFIVLRVISNVGGTEEK